MDINKDFIGVIREKSDGFVEYDEIPIIQDDILIAEVEAMKGNDNRSLLDLQSKFTEYYPNSIYKNKSYNYLYPYGYYSSYLDLTRYPHIVSSEEYRDVVNNEERRLRTEYIDNDQKRKSLESLKQRNSVEYEREIQRIDKIIHEKMNDFCKRKKDNFSYKQFIYAHNYTNKLNEIKVSEDIKMYSTDQLGWSSFSYSIDKDLTIQIQTNFGYGRSSYFFCNLKYKDIQILPYTCIIKYFKVQWTDFVRYTRKYSASRGSWKDVFEFVVDTANFAKRDQDEFVKVWIVNEIEEMMKGVKAIMLSPKESLEKFINSYTEESEYNTSVGFHQLVSNCYGNDVKEYMILPQEKIMAYKAEKITGCLKLLDNLKQLQQITNVADECIREIEKYNYELYPEIIQHINVITIEIIKLEKRLNKKQEELLELQGDIKKLSNKREKFVDRMRNRTVKRGKPFSYNDAEKEFHKKYPEFKKSLRKEEKMKIKISEIKEIIWLRNSFKNVLTECAAIVEENINVA